MRTFHLLATDALRPYVDRLWGWESAAGETIALPTLLPGTGAELYFHYRRPFRYTTGTGAQAACDAAHLLCVRRQPVDLADASDIGFVAVRFRAGMLHRFTDVPGQTLLDRPHAVEDIWERQGRTLVHRLACAASLDERLHLIQTFLLSQLRDQPADAIVEHAIARIYRECSTLAIERLAEDCGLGRRQLERRFLALTGQTAAEVRRLSRFQNTVRALMLNRHAATLDTALAHGYYDQSHFIREFRALALASPQRHLDAARGRTHFYNPPRSTLSKMDASVHLV